MPDQIEKTQHPPVDGSRPELDQNGRPAQDGSKRAGEQPGGGRPSESEKPNSPDSRWGSGGDKR